MSGTLTDSAVTVMVSYIVWIYIEICIYFGMNLFWNKLKIFLRCSYTDH